MVAFGNVVDAGGGASTCGANDGSSARDPGGGMGGGGGSDAGNASGNSAGVGAGAVCRVCDGVRVGDGIEELALDCFATGERGMGDGTRASSRRRETSRYTPRKLSMIPEVKASAATGVKRSKSRSTTPDPVIEHMVNAT